VAMNAAIEKAAKNPATTSAAYNKMAPRWSRIDALLGGTAAMREMSTEYLPQHEHETSKSYDTRLKKATLLNMTELTLESLVGKPFSDPVKLNDDVPESVRSLTDDIDLQGNDIHTFCRAWYREAVAKGFSHVLIDFPRMAEEEREVRTLADDMNDRRQPYWIHVKPENLIFASSTTANGVEVLEHVRVYEPYIERYGFTEVERERIKVWEPGVWQVWEPSSKKKNEWEKTDEGTYDLDLIPLVTYYANREGLMLGKPPIEDLAFLNVQHWQLSADLMNTLTVANFPMLAVSGAHDQSGDVLKVGPNQLLGTRNENGKFYYVEHEGKAIKAAEDRLARLEDAMAAYGAEFLRKKPGAQTATARALDSAESTSALQDMTRRFTDAVEVALDITAMWLKEEQGGTVTMLLDYGPEEISDVDMRTLNEARRNRDLSRTYYFKELQRRGTIADEFDEAENLRELQEEPQIASPFATGTNVNFDGSSDSGVDNRARDKDGKVINNSSTKDRKGAPGDQGPGDPDDGDGGQ
jgi:hypothetical protein